MNRDNVGLWRTVVADGHSRVRLAMYVCFSSFTHAMPVALGNKSLLPESFESNWITSGVAIVVAAVSEMRSVEERAYEDALAAYREILATLDGQLRSGKISREDLQSERDANARLDAARRAYLDALEPS